MRFIGVIPARYRSVRLPGKALIKIAGKPLIEWVYLRASGASRLSRVMVATDDERIRDSVRAFGGEAVMTRADHLSGTDRVAEVAATLDADVFINIQGDEPLISPDTIDRVCQPFLEHKGLAVSTARVALPDRSAAESPHVTKVVVDSRGRALYFSRSPIPYPRREPAPVFKHLGIYGYQKDFLLNLPALLPSELERIEGLEQLRFLENGIGIQVVTVESDSIGVDTPEDVERVRPVLENQPVPEVSPERETAASIHNSAESREE